jgi:hypothetical protein
MTSFNPYEILQVPEGAPLTEIKRSYRQLSLKLHPDKNPVRNLAVRSGNSLFVLMLLSRTIRKLRNASSSSTRRSRR